MREWVVDASPIIILGRAQLLHLLPKLPTRLVIPEEVAREIAQGPQNDPARAWLESEAKQSVVSCGSISLDIASWDLGHGESAVLSFALRNTGFEAVVDDRAARRCAATLRIPVVGTIGIVIRACKTGILPSAPIAFEQLRKAGLFLTDEIISKALVLAGESGE